MQYKDIKVGSKYVICAWPDGRTEPTELDSCNYKLGDVITITDLNKINNAYSAEAEERLIGYVTTNKHASGRWYMLVKPKQLLDMENNLTCSVKSVSGFHAPIYTNATVNLPSLTVPSPIYSREPIASIHVTPSKKVVVVKFKFGPHRTEVVKCDDQDNFDPYVGVAIAIARHQYGTTSQFHKYVDKRIVYHEDK